MQHPITHLTAEMPRYISHKQVWALEIASVIGRKLSFADKGNYADMEAPEEMFARYKPVPGDFYVVYSDGYKSFSPRKAFVEGYSRTAGSQVGQAGLNLGLGRVGQAGPAVSGLPIGAGGYSEQKR